ncbi:Translation elongation factor LepA [Leptospirillum ferriphilum]|uniref:Elongation factor 4 n=1 Tax=Leptospirillum ferriphilum TaxID=178606 RepID=A0A094W741_9BACT|nr:translation elongation factor 4 [Leptospirillum ferriphilum]KGA93303.1 Translation elongation factor LepA [Leptospirillum ferriphilum]
MSFPLERIRNFCIIAHIDHGKSTLADRLLEMTGSVTARETRDQQLDAMDLERERGITIKAHTVRLVYRARDGQDYLLNLIDTPGHVDFTYEVSRSLAACEGALLVVDASQGVEAQTIANAYLALENDVHMIPVINKIDLPGADIEKTREQIEEAIGLPSEDALLISAKAGIGVEDVLEAVVARVPPPVSHPGRSLKALLFDSWFDPFQGAVILVRVFDGTIRVGDRFRLFSTGRTHEVLEISAQTPKKILLEELGPGEVGIIVSGIKSVRETRIGDTLVLEEDPAPEAFPGFHEAKPMVFCGLFPTETEQYDDLKEALEKLRLNDASFTFEMETSLALGFGFRCGFLGLLHMEIIQERLEREFHLTLISTAPTVVYRVRLLGGASEEILVVNPSELPPPNKIDEVFEPFILGTLFLPAEYLGPVMALCQEKRAVQKDMRYLDSRRVSIQYEMPLNEVVLDFYDRLKSISKGYASFDYEWLGYRPSNLVKVDVMVNGEQVDALSFIVHQDKAYTRARLLVEKLKEVIPRQMFEVALQAAIGSRIIARETIGAMRKNVLAKCYGGDITRKRKLLEKQKEGKKRMKQIGRVEVPQEAFMAVLRVSETGKDPG